MGDSIGPGFKLTEGLDVLAVDDSRLMGLPIGQFFEDFVAAPIRTRPIRATLPSFQQSRFVGQQ